MVFAVPAVDVAVDGTPVMRGTKPMCLWQNRGNTAFAVPRTDTTGIATAEKGTL